MSAQKIKEAVQQLSHEELADFRSWFAAFDGMLNDNSFWSRVSDRSLLEVWDNTEDDIYAELLQG